MLKLYYYPSYVSLFPHILLEEIGVEHELSSSTDSRMPIGVQIT
jgi:hypothetical protein